MKQPKTSKGVRYLSSDDYDVRAYFIQPNMGNAADGTPLPPATIATVWCSVALWRGKQNEKTQLLQGSTSYKVSIRYPRTFALDTGMTIQIRGQVHNIESFADIDDTRNELTIYTWVGNDQIGRTSN